MFINGRMFINGSNGRMFINGRMLFSFETFYLMINEGDNYK